MITAIAIDDEPSAIEVIKHHVSKLQNIELVADFHNPIEAIDYLKNNPVDLIFLDINMPQMSGLELLQSLQIIPAIIFTTAYGEFAVDSYKYNAVDYLLKPFEFDRFQVAIQKAEKQIASLKSNQKFFFIKDGFKNIKISFENILFVKSSGNYLDIFTNEKTFSPRMTFNDLLQKIPVNQFIRVHQSYLINIEVIEKIENNHIYIESHQIPISLRYKEGFFKRLNL